MSVLSDISDNVSAVTSALESPMSVAANALSMTSELSSLQGYSDQITGLYEDNKDLIDLALGESGAAEDLLGDFSSYITDGIPSDGSIGKTLASQFSSELSAVNTAIDTANSLAATQASATQALACLNIDFTAADAISDLWETFGTFTDNAMGIMTDCCTKAYNYVVSIVDSAFDFAMDVASAPVETLQEIYSMAKNCYTMLSGLASKVTDYITSSDLYTEFITLATDARDAIMSCMGSLSAAIGCGSSVMSFIGEGASAIAAYSPDTLHAIQAVNEAKSDLINDYIDTIDTLDDTAV